MLNYFTIDEPILILSETCFNRHLKILVFSYVKSKTLLIHNEATLDDSSSIRFLHWNWNFVAISFEVKMQRLSTFATNQSQRKVSTCVPRLPRQGIKGLKVDARERSAERLARPVIVLEI